MQSTKTRIFLGVVLLFGGCASDGGNFGDVVAPNLTLQPLYADTKTDALRGARGASYRGRSEAVDDTSHNPCFSKGDAGEGTFIDVCRRARVGNDASTVRWYFLAGVALSDQICQHHLNRLTVRETGYGGLSDVISQGGAAAATIMAVTAASDRATGVIGSLFQLGGGVSSVARNRLSLAASTEAVYTLVNETRALRRNAMLVNEPVDFWTAYRVLEQYHQTCSYPAIRQAINAAVVQGARTASEATTDAVALDRARYASLLRAAGFNVLDEGGTLDRVAALHAVIYGTRSNLTPNVIAIVNEIPRVKGDTDPAPPSTPPSADLAGRQCGVDAQPQEPGKSGRFRAGAGWHPSIGGDHATFHRATNAGPSKPAGAAVAAAYA